MNTKGVILYSIFRNPLTKKKKSPARDFYYGLVPQFLIVRKGDHEK